MLKLLTFFFAWLGIFAIIDQIKKIKRIKFDFNMKEDVDNGPME